MTSLTSGDRKLLVAEDTGTCAPAGTPGDTYSVGAWYKAPAGSTASPRFFAYYHTSASGWRYWSNSPRFPTSSGWTQVSWTTPPLPAGADLLSVGMGLDTPGSVTMDDFSLTQTDSSPPTVPTGLTAQAGDGQVKLSWSSSTDSDSPVAGYHVLRNGSRIASVTSGTTYTDSGLTDGTAYSYTVEAYDPAGNISGPSGAVSSTPMDSTAPTVPQGLQAKAGVGQVSLSWSASQDNVGVVGYDVFRNGTRVAQVSGTTYSDTGLSAGTAYQYYVEAYDAAGNTSGPSSTVSATPTSPATSGCPSPGPVTTWAPPGQAPLSDAQAAACVVHQPENRPGNVQYNDYVPSAAELQAFHTSIDDNGQVADTAVPTRRYVTGRPGLSNPSTDDLIQWVAHKWGIPEDWIRAEMAVESWWTQTDLGDRATVSAAWYTLYPAQARIAGTSDVYQSMGISQVKWAPNGSNDTGTEPLRWKSTAFALDYYAAKVRYFYDGDCNWCTSGYSAGQAWNSIGAWYQPYPWGNTGQQSYISTVQQDLQNRVWAKPGF